MQSTPAPAQPQVPIAPGVKKLFHEQFPDERVTLLLRKDIMFLVRSMLIELLIVTGLLVLLGSSIAFDWSFIEEPWFWLVYLVAFLILFCWGFVHWFNWRYDLYVITDRRIVDSTRRFPLKKRLAEAQLDRVQDTSYEKSGLFANVFDYGTIVIQTAGESTNFQWEGMPNPVQAQAIVRQAVEEDLRRDAMRRQGTGGLN